MNRDTLAEPGIMYSGASGAPLDLWKQRVLFKAPVDKPHPERYRVLLGTVSTDLQH